jgi:hypothetical protein
MEECKYRFEVDDRGHGVLSKIHCRERICRYWKLDAKVCGYDGPVMGVCV